MPILILIVLFLAVVGLVLGVGFWLNRDQALSRRLKQLHDKSAALGNAAQARQEWRVKFIKLVAPIARLSSPNEDGDASYLQARFMNAGLRQAYWPMVFFVAKTVFTLLFPGLFLGYRGLVGTVAMSQAMVLALLMLCTLGYYLPNLLLAAVIGQRKQELEDALPDAIDLMTVCMEAGLAIDSAMKRTCGELDLRSRALADELRLVGLELQVGASRASAMHNLALRTGVEDVATFVTILLQAEHFGTDVAGSLRVLSETMRDNRRLRAEERAAKIPLKLLVPTILFIFPSLFVVLLGSAVISIIRALGHTVGGAQ